ncbi:hypothetical protein ACEPPN_003930 [Leptodophora sp. 'Broadleaf-Isolate-01']
MGLFDTAKEKFSSKVNDKATKYAGLSDSALLDKDVKKQRQVNRRQLSTGAASAACIGTSGISAGKDTLKEGFLGSYGKVIVQRRR